MSNITVVGFFTEFSLLEWFSDNSHLVYVLRQKEKVLRDEGDPKIILELEIQGNSSPEFYPAGIILNGAFEDQ